MEKSGVEVSPGLTCLRSEAGDIVIEARADKNVKTLINGTVVRAETSAAVVEGRTFAQGAVANAADRAVLKGIYTPAAAVSVSVPSITDPDIAKVDVDVSAALTYAPAVGDAVIAIPLVALPTNCRLQGAQVTATDTVQITFGSEGGNVTGAAKNFSFLFFDLT